MALTARIIPCLDVRGGRVVKGINFKNIIKDKLKNFVHILKEKLGDINGRVFVDSAPILERAWAKKSGLGWIGKNTNLISKKTGSFFFIAEIIVDIDLQPDQEVTDHCGQCTACLDACPTGAFYEPDVASSTTAIGRKLLFYARDVIETCYSNKKITLEDGKEVIVNAECVYGDTDSVFFKFNLLDAKTEKKIINKEANF